MEGHPALILVLCFRHISHRVPCLSAIGRVEIESKSPISKGGIRVDPHGDDFGEHFSEAGFRGTADVRLLPSQSAPPTFRARRVDVSTRVPGSLNAALICA